MTPRRSRTALRILTLTVLAWAAPCEAREKRVVVDAKEWKDGELRCVVHRPEVDYVFTRIDCGLCEGPESRTTFVDAALRSAQSLATRDSAPRGLAPAPRR